MIGLLLLGTMGVSEAAVLVTDPNDVGNNINTLGVTMNEEVGNTSLGVFNSLAGQRTFTMDSAGYTDGSVLDNSFVLTSGGSGVDKTLAMSGGSPVTFWVRNTPNADYLSSGVGALSRGSGSSDSTFTFDTAVQAFGFTVNRLAGDPLTINLYSDSGGTAQIATYVMARNDLTTDHSFFGYTSATQNIVRIDLVRTNNLQFSVDDVSFSNTSVQIPEPSSLTLLAGGFVAVYTFRRRRAANSSVS